MNLISLRNVVLKSVSEAFAKQFDRKQVDEGIKHSIVASCKVSGEVDGLPFSFHLPVDATLTVGHSTTRTSSVTPAVENQLAYALELIELAYGESVVSDIVRDIEAKYAETRTVPASEKYLELVSDLARRMREERQQAVAGSVSVKQASQEAVSFQFEAVA